MVRDRAVLAAESAFRRIAAEPSAADLWELQKALLANGGASAARARIVARGLHASLRALESQVASRNASRWGAVLGTAAVGSVGLRDLLGSGDGLVGRLLETAVPAALEVGSAVQSARAWEVEAGLVFDEFAWFLYDELWDVSAASRPDLSAEERRARIDELLDPIVDPSVSDVDRASLVVDVFRAVLAARLAPVLEPSSA
jgi:hypothetical protein